MKKSIICIWLVVFVLFFIAPQTIYALVGEYLEVENYENRVPAEKPVLEFGTIETYPAEFETYYNDTLPFRTQLLETNGLINYYCFKESPVSKVIVGKDNWLFYNPDGADGDPIGDMNGDTWYSDGELEVLKETFLKARDTLAAQGREFIIMITPNKESVYGNRYLPDIYCTGNEYTTADQVVEYLRENSDLRIVYPKGELQKAMEEFPEYEVYYSADTHWNSVGGYIGAKCLLEELDYNLPELNEEMIAFDEQDAPKDLANMMGLAKYVSEDNSYGINMASNVCVTTMSEDFWGAYHYKVDTLNSKKLFFIRDSFATAMIPYIREHFAESYFVHAQAYTPELIDEVDADTVVYEITERSIVLMFNFTVE